MTYKRAKENPAPDSNRERGKKVLTNDRQYLTLLLYKKAAARVKAGKTVTLQTVTLQMGKVPEIRYNLESGVITFVLPSLDEPQTMKALIEAARARGLME